MWPTSAPDLGEAPDQIEIDASFTEGYTGAHLADHLGVDAVPAKADDP